GERELEVALAARGERALEPFGELLERKAPPEVVPTQQRGRALPFTIADQRHEAGMVAAKRGYGRPVAAGEKRHAKGFLVPARRLIVAREPRCTVARSIGLRLLLGAGEGPGE